VEFLYLVKNTLFRVSSTPKIYIRVRYSKNYTNALLERIE